MTSVAATGVARPAALGLPILGALAALAWFAGLQAVALQRAGVFEYPLDDVYIHLAMASGIAHGTYGINPGEPASAASSALYPLLLSPFPGTETQRMLPLIWNTLAVAGIGALWGAALAAGGIGGRIGAVLAALGPLALNAAGLAFTGMEHALHAVLALAAVLGLWRLLQTGQLAPWFVAALIAAPLIRPEGLALSLAAAGVVALRRPIPGCALGLATLLPVVAFAGFLVSQGLDPLPSSVLTKVSNVSQGSGPLGLDSHQADALAGQAGATGPTARLLNTLRWNLHEPAALLVAALAAAAGLRALTGRGAAEARLLLAAVALAGLAHLLAGHFGWMNRYEIYVLLALVAALAIAWDRAAGGARGTAPVMVALTLVAGLVIYLPPLLREYLWNPWAIHRQQAQMARFAHEFLPEPVAVNDIGRVAWGAPAYVLDLWGLAYAPAREKITARPPAAPGWAGPLAEAKGVRYAMIYDDFLARAVGPDWVRLAELRLPDTRAMLGGPTVTIYATSAASVDEVNRALDAFAPTLPRAVALSRLTGEAAQ